MKRREFIALVGATAVAWQRAAHAQTPKKIARIGYLSPGNRTVSANFLEAFLRGLRELDYVEGQTFTMEYRWGEGRIERLPELAVELVRLEPDVLVATTSAAVQAAMTATRTIPIIMAGGGDPVGLGLVASLARPGGNVTGPSMMNTEVVSKRIEILKEIISGLRRVAVLTNSLNPIHALFMQETEPTARMLGLELQPIEVHGPEDFEAAFAAARQGWCSYRLRRFAHTSIQIPDRCPSRREPNPHHVRLSRISRGGRADFIRRQPVQPLPPRRHICR